MSELSGALHTWQASGRHVRVETTEIWYRVKGHGPWLVCFHGFPTSSWDWHRLLPLLEPHRRVLVFDFPGYGLSAKPAWRDYSIHKQVDTAESLLNYLEIRDFHLLSHDMGDTAACELVHRVKAGNTGLRPRTWTLLNGGLYPELHRPLPTQRLLRTPVLGALTARFSSWRVFKHQYQKVYADPGGFSEEHYREQWSLMLNNSGRATLARVACYMRERLRHRDRWEASLHEPGMPMKLVWGREDPIAVHDIARKLAHRNLAVKLVTLDGVGHYPQLESRHRVAEEVLEQTAEA